MFSLPSLRKLVRFGSDSLRHDRRPANRKKTAGPRLRLEPLETRLAPAVIVWDGGLAGTGTNWNDAVNWVGDVLPGVNDDAVIGSAFSGITITHSTNPTSIRSLNSAAALSISGGSFSIAVDSVINNALTLSNGELGGDGDLAVNGLLTWTGGTMSGGGWTFANQGMNISGVNQKVLNGRTVNNAGTATWTGTGTINAGNGAIFANLAGATFAAQNDTSFFHGFGAVPVINNAGTFRKAAGTGTTTIGVALNNLSGGTVEVLAGAPPKTLSLTGGGTSTGAFTVAAGNILNFGGGTHFLNAGSSVSGAGTVSFTSGGVFVAGSYNVAGTTTISGGSVAFNSAATIATGTLSSGVLGGTGTVTVTGTLTWTGGSMEDVGTTAIAASGTLAISGANQKVLNTRRVNNAGTVTWTGTGTINAGNGAIFTNLAGGTFTAQNDTSFFHGFGAVPTFNNAGTFRKAAGAGTTTIGVTFDNTGTLEVQVGTVFLSGAFTNFAGTSLRGGTYIVNSNTTLRFNNADIRTNRATIVLNGTNSQILNQSGANGLLNFNVNAASGSFTIQGGRNFTTAGNFSNAGTLTVGSGSTFIVIGDLTNFSGTTLTGGTYIVAGTLRFTNADIVTNAATIVLDGSGLITDRATTPLDGLRNFAVNAGSFTLQNGHSRTTASGTFTNSGSLAVASGSTLTVPGGNTYQQTAGSTTLTNGTLAAGLVDIQAGSLNGTGTVNANLTNAGQLNPGGAGPGLLTVNGNFTQAAGGTLNIQLNGTAPGSGHDQLAVNGTVTLGGTLNTSLGFSPASNTTFTVLANDLADAVGGTFSGLPQGRVVNIGGTFFQISYSGGTGNDVVLTVLPATFRILDNGETGFAVTSGWTLLNDTTFGVFQGLQGDVHFVEAGSGSEVATWTFTNLAPGTYRVSTTWFADPNRATDAPYTVFDGTTAGTSLGTVLINQEQTPNDFRDAGIEWEELGIFTITSGTLTVRLTNLANEFVIADAICIERLA